ncbi:hypothetical protein [Paraburkholderia kirstenboschensis]|uniref:Secreted protein n=1 Tax=Paraburkholderia kirstenboschensis TaxID=1245436 RepID=A0ABZ0ED21_9BURK|nr:hypothetical protein [Paraburkholderia kirstenboschensis]WOD14414.1 hypothetical protein RW095_02730 [Paraburkholderia kirstenboschensis]
MALWFNVALVVFATCAIRFAAGKPGDDTKLDAAAFQKMIRFNEAIDQMLAEAVRQFAKNVEPICN